MEADTAYYWGKPEQAPHYSKWSMYVCMFDRLNVKFPLKAKKIKKILKTQCAQDGRFMKTVTISIFTVWRLSANVVISSAG